MPRLNHKVSFREQIRAKHQFSLDVLCRLLVPVSYRNTIQATNPFLEVNHHLLEPVKTINPQTSRTVNGVKLKKWELHASDSDEDGIMQAVEAFFINANLWISHTSKHGRYYEGPQVECPF